MNINQMALGCITLAVSATLSYMAITDKIKPDAYLAGMMGVFATWLKTDNTEQTHTTTTKDRPKL
jgi:hypothetical protein